MISALALSIRRSFDFTGRSGRAEFWWTWSVVYALSMLIMAWRGLPMTSQSAAYVATGLLCVLALPAIAVGTRRLADAGVWRWLFVVVFLFGIFAQIIYRIPVPSEEALATLSVQFDDTIVPASELGYYPLLRWLHDVMPWIGRPLALLCLLLALLPSRPSDEGADDPERQPA
ncbi:MAG: DUF805 domain-containing protein [Pseudomonadota bacterium]